MLTTIVHEELPARTPFTNSINWVPETAVNVPPQLFTGAGAVPPAISKPAGKESLTPISISSIFPVF